MKRDKDTMKQTYTLRLGLIAYDIAALTVAIPSAMLIRTGVLAPPGLELQLLMSSFIVFAATCFWSRNLWSSARNSETPSDILSLACWNVIIAMAAAIILSFVATRLEGIPRTVPFIAALVAATLVSVPRLPGMWSSMRERLKAPEAQQNEVGHQNCDGLIAANKPSPRAQSAPLREIGFKQGADIVVVTCLPVAVGMATFGPQGLTWFCTIMAAIMVVIMTMESERGRWLAAFHPVMPLALAISLFLAWALARSIWSPTIATALPTLSSFTLALFSVLLAAVAAFRIRPGRYWYWIFFPIVNIAAAVLTMTMLIIVSRSGFELLGTGRLIQGYHYNRVALFVALLHPISFFAIEQMQISRAGRWSLQIATGAAVFFAVFWSESESAQLALLLMVIVHLAWKINSVWTMRAFTLALVITILALPVIMDGLFALIKASALWDFRPGTFAARVTIWESISGLIKSAPFIGNGVEVIRVEGVLGGANQGPQMHHHPHSFLLQTWVDLGFVGAFLMAGCFLATSDMIRRVPGDGGRMLILVATGILSIWAVSHGMWQAWFVGLSGVVVVFAVLAYRRSLGQP